MNSKLPPAPIFGSIGNEDKVPRTGIVSLVDIFDEFLFSSDRASNNPSSTNNISTINNQTSGYHQQQHLPLPPSQMVSSSSSNQQTKPTNQSYQQYNPILKSELSSSSENRNINYNYQTNTSNLGMSSINSANNQANLSGMDDLDYDSDEMDDSLDDKRRKRSRGITRNMTEEQKVERRERNREHAKRSRVRKKFLLESLQQSVRALEEENEKLRNAIREHLKGEADQLLARCTMGGPSVIASDPSTATTTLDDPDYSLVKALQTAQQNFVISDPSLPDNPIVYASQGFLTLTGYTLNQILGRNCRFLQGPETDSKAVDRIRRGIEKGEDTTVVLLNYRQDGTTFWNQFFVAALRDGDGNIVNYLGVQCKVSGEYAEAFLKSEELEENRSSGAAK